MAFLNIKRPLSKSCKFRRHIYLSLARHISGVSQYCTKTCGIQFEMKFYVDKESVNIYNITIFTSAIDDSFCQIGWPVSSQYRYMLIDILSKELWYCVNTKRCVDCGDVTAAVCATQCVRQSLNKHEKQNQCWFKAGPSSTLARPAMLVHRTLFHCEINIRRQILTSMDGPRAQRVNTYN